jgi:hypothetical protein
VVARGQRSSGTGPLADVALLRRISTSILSDEECELLSASYRDAMDWTAADGALLDELVQLLDPCPSSTSSTWPACRISTLEIPEVFTTADLLSPCTRPDPFELPHETYAHLLIDEAQDVSPMQWRCCVGAAEAPAGPLWATRAELLARRQGGRSCHRGDHRHRPRTALPDEHQLPQPSEVFDLAAKVVVADFPDADLPTAVRSTDTSRGC